ncbi:hypothetical protein Adeh_1472 [Anaeromyxobacter dehalogenans 2CP-C]|uniref:Uncharacterized protein n=2 Tax=Anaeromyxobacter dehalogenans TaxID=161493 RepID=Q2IHW1_ANADE|nr:hypothetical protein Adeh_1472 [Anaeromyxobacter dehalogenans 2CP-C]
MFARVGFCAGAFAMLVSAAYGLSHRSGHADSREPGGNGAGALAQQSAAVEQRSQGSNSPNYSVSTIVNGPVTINAPPPTSPPPRPGVRVEDRIGVSKEDGTEWEEVTFWNPGDKTTPVFDILILDASRNVIASFKPPNANRIEPPLPANIEAGGVSHFKIKLTPNEAQNARWFQYKSEPGLSDPAPWAERRRYIYLSAKAEARTTPAATLTVQKLKVTQEFRQFKGGVVTKGITFTNDTDAAVAVLDLRVLDAGGAEIVNFRSPQGRITPQLPLNIEPHRAFPIMVELTQEQTGRGEWLEWEEAGGDKPRAKWTHREVSVEAQSVSTTPYANSANVGAPPPSGARDPKQAEGERK